MKCVTFCLCFFWSFVTLTKPQVLPVEEHHEGNQHLIHLIATCDKEQGFTKFITYCRNADLDSSGSITTSVQQLLMETFRRPIIVGGNHIGPLNTLVNSKTLIVVLFGEMRDHIFDIVRQTLFGFNLALVIFDYRPKNGSPPKNIEMDDFFEWCLQRNLNHVILTFKRNNEFELWSYKSKPKLNKVTFKEKEISAHNHREFHKHAHYRFSVGLFENLPEVFLVSKLH